MNYYEYAFTYESALDKEIISDVLAAELGGIGFESFQETGEGLLAYVPENDENEGLVKGKIEAFPLAGVLIHYGRTYIKSKNWNEEWEKNYFQPITVGEECIIHASFHEIGQEYKYNIVIDPKMAFGTGNHATTRLMMAEMLKLDLEGKELLDMGCGTAVLAILAAKMGAGRVTAIDIDEWAYNNALENIRLNHTEKVLVMQGGAGQIDASQPFDYIFANINRNILLQDIGTYAGALRKHGYLFMSGFYKDDIPAIAAECNKHGLAIQSFEEQDNWVAVKTQY